MEVLKHSSKTSIFKYTPENKKYSANRNSIVTDSIAKKRKGFVRSRLGKTTIKDLFAKSHTTRIDYFFGKKR